MALAKCPRSGKVYDNKSGPVHPDVMHEEEADYMLLAEYVREHPNCKPEEACEETGVSLACLKRMVKEERLAEFSPKELEQREAEVAERQEELNKQRARMARGLSEAKADLMNPKSSGKGTDGASVHDILADKRRTE